MPTDAGLLAVQMLLAAFAGGAIGAAIGPLPSLGLSGLAVVVGEVSPSLGVPAGASTPAAWGPSEFTALVALGPALGPHVAFAGGVAATAYAGRKGYLDTDFEYHEAKHVTVPLGSKPDVLVVGGVFGVVGYWLTQLSVQFGLPVDPIAASVAASALLHRIVFGYPLIGAFGGGLLDMTPYEEGRRRMAADGSGDAESLTGRYVVEPWLPAHYEWSNVAVLGLVAGLFGGFVGLVTGSYYLAFGLSAATLLLLAAGRDRTPVTFHMVLPASLAALALPDASVPVALVVAGLFGVIGGIAGELIQRVLYAHGDTHFDPGFASILLTSLLIAVLEVAGVFTQAAVPTAGLA